MATIRTFSCHIGLKLLTGKGFRILTVQNTNIAEMGVISAMLKMPENEFIGFEVGDHVLGTSKNDDS